MKKNILVFPCGSEIALEVYRSVNKSSHFHLIGANSIEDHGSFVFEDYIGNVPFITSQDFLSSLRNIVKDRHIDAIYPAMDAVIEIVKKNEEFLGCKVVSSPTETTEICLSKSKTYKKLSATIKVPKICKEEDLNFPDSLEYPLFAKPDIGYGSRGAKKINTSAELKIYCAQYKNRIISEYLPGQEFTVDCFTDKTGSLLFSAPRERSRIMNGISVKTKPVTIGIQDFKNFADKINKELHFRGAWFFQVKYDKKGKLTLLEIASRLGGSSSLFRAYGVNFALMSLFDTFDIPVSISLNQCNVEMDRALDNKYKISINYNEIFVDFDDCLYLEKKSVNSDLLGFLYKSINEGIRITLLSKHDDEKLGKLEDLLESLRIRQIFDRIIHIKAKENKADYIDNSNSIFIDDSFAERKAIADKFKIPVFSLDMIEVLK